jgi:hypothetical protein
MFNFKLKTEIRTLDTLWNFYYDVSLKNKVYKGNFYFNGMQLIIYFIIII